jgi:hypothetical protein
MLLDPQIIVLYLTVALAALGRAATQPVTSRTDPVPVDAALLERVTGIEPA